MKTNALEHYLRRKLHMGWVSILKRLMTFIMIAVKGLFESLFCFLCLGFVRCIIFNAGEKIYVNATLFFTKNQRKYLLFSLHGN